MSYRKSFAVEHFAAASYAEDKSPLGHFTVEIFQPDDILS